MSITTQLKEICPTCKKPAITSSVQEIQTKYGNQLLITLACKHVILTKAKASSDFARLYFDHDPKCFHEWDKNTCVNCGGKRLYPFQALGASLIEKHNGRFGIFDEQGLGKTIQALAYLKFNRDAWPFLWVTKAGTKYQHGKEIIRVLTADGFAQPIITSKDKLWPNVNYVAGYDIFRRMSSEVFTNAGIKTLILDECQAIKNVDAQRTQALRKIAKDIPGIIALSGTPWKNRGSEFFTVLNLLDPKLFPSRQGFIDEWVDTYLGYGGKLVEGGIKDVEKFREKTSHIFIRRERTEVLPELPLVNRTRVICEVPEHARKAYNDEQKKLIAIANKAALEGTDNTLEFHQATNEILMTMRQILGIAKIPTTVELAQEILEETEHKLVIFIHHKEVGKIILNQMHNWCKENGLPEPLKLTADMTPLDRFQVQEKFNGPNYRLLIGSTLASGEGLNLQSCFNCIMHERQWNPANEEQAEGRFPRIGSTATSINVRYMHADNSIDIDLDAIVEGKRRAFHNTMNKGEMPIWDEQNIVSMLVDRIRKQKPM